jgi:hypothetical protein
LSKFIEMLTKVDDQAPEPMGFGRRNTDRRPSRALAIAGTVAPSGLAKSKAGVEFADAVLLTSTDKDQKTLDKAAARLDGELWGVRGGAVSGEQARHLAESGCDFMVFDAEGTSAALLDVEDMGKIISIGDELDDDMARSIAGIPIDAVLYTPGELDLPLTVGGLLAISRIRGLLDLPYIMAVSGAITGDDIAALRNVGIAGLVMDLAALDDIASTAKAIKDLPKRKPRKSRSSAIVPHVAADEPHEHDDDDYPDEDEDY